MQIISHSTYSMPDPIELSPEEQQEAAFRYMQAKYGKLEDQAAMYENINIDNVEQEASKIIGTEIHSQIEKHYTDMVHRNPDGPDPLVQEPKD